MRQIAILVSLLFVTSVLGHTWLDCVKMTPQGCQGFIRGYPGRLQGVDTDRLATYKILNRPSSVPICFPGRQSSDNTYSGQFPMATAYPGDELTFTYTENGHVTKDKIPPNNSPNPKTYTIHWNGRGGRPGAQLTDRNQLNDGTRLLSPVNFDDGQCGEDRNPPMFRNGQPCRGRFRIPDGLQPGVYQFVWWWIFDKIPNAGGEEYTSCFDVRVLSRDNGPAAPPRITPNDPQTTRPPAPKPNNPSPNPSDGAGVSCDRCTRGANPNRDTGAGYQYFLQSCLSGGLGCIGNSGCRMCTTKPWRNPGVVQCPSCVYDAFGLPKSLAQGMDSSDNSTFDGDRSSVSPSPTSSAAGVILSVLAVISVVVLNLLI